MIVSMRTWCRTLKIPQWSCKPSIVLSERPFISPEIPSHDAMMPWCLSNTDSVRETASKLLDEEIEAWMKWMKRWYFMVPSDLLDLLTIFNLEKLKWQDFSGRPIIACIAWLSHRGLAGHRAGRSVCRQILSDVISLPEVFLHLWNSAWWLSECYGKGMAKCPFCCARPLDALGPDFNLTGKSKQSQTLSACGRDMDFFVGFSLGVCSSSVFVPPSSLPKNNPTQSTRKSGPESCEVATWGYHWLHGDSHDHLHRHGQCLSVSSVLGTTRHRFPSVAELCGRSQDLWRWRSIGTRRGQEEFTTTIWIFTEITETEELYAVQF